MQTTEDTWCEMHWSQHLRGGPLESLPPQKSVS